MSDMNLTDWLTFVPAGAIAKRRAYIDLPAFSYVSQGTSGDASIIVAQFNFSASRDFYLLTRPTKPVGVNYGLCIRYRVGETVYRYKLWEDNSFILSSATPTYNKQLIKKNFVLEVWNFAGVTSSNAAAKRMVTSVRATPTDFRDVTDYALAIGAEFTALDNTNVAPTTRSTTDLVADYSANLSQCVLDGSNNVQDVADISGNGRTLTQGTAGLRPAHSFFSPPTPVLPYDTILFDGIDNLLSWVGGGISSTNGWSVYLIGANKVYTNNAFMFTSGPGGVGIRAGTSSPDIHSNVNLFNGATMINSVPINEVGLIEAFLDNTNVYLFGNGFLPGTYNGVVTGSQDAHSQGVRPSQTAWTFGGFGATCCGLQLARCMIYNRLHDSATRTLIRQYLENLYNLGGITLPLTMNSGGAWLDNP